MILSVLSESAARAIVLHPATIATRSESWRLQRLLIEHDVSVEDATVLAGAIARWKCETVPPNSTQRRSMALWKSSLEKLGLWFTEVNT